MPNDPTQQFRWTGDEHHGGRAMSWRQNSDYCLDAFSFQPSSSRLFRRVMKMNNTSISVVRHRKTR